MAEFVKKYPAERTITVVIGRLKRELNDLAGAIDALDRCIQARNGLGPTQDPIMQPCISTSVLPERPRKEFRWT